MRVALTYNEKRSAGEAHAEFDTRAAIESVAALVRGLGHDAVPIDVTGSVPALVARLARARPDVVLNLAEGERGAFREAFYPALFEQLGLRHTGSAPSTLAVCLDKSLAKRIVAAAGVRVPGPPRRGRRAVVKPNLEGSSKGVAVVDYAEVDAALAACRYAHPIAEELVDGTEVGVGWFAGLGTLPAIAYRFAGPIYSYALKHETPEAVMLEIPARLPAIAMRRLRIAARRVFAALGVTTYGRADFRITPDGEPVFLELNPLPSLTLAPGHDELYEAAARIGRSPSDVIAAVLDLNDSPR